MTEEAWAKFYARFLSWRYGRKVVAPYFDDGMDGESTWQEPMRFADTWEPVQSCRRE